jgi:hypothetical protein
MLSDLQQYLPLLLASHTCPQTAKQGAAKISTILVPMKQLK